MAYEDYYEEDCGEFAEDECTYGDDDFDDDAPAPEDDKDDGAYDDQDDY